MARQDSNIAYTAQELWAGHDVCQGQIIHKPSKWELSILLDSHFIDKIRLSVKFRQ